MRRARVATRRRRGALARGVVLALAGLAGLAGLGGGAGLSGGGPAAAGCHALSLAAPTSKARTRVVVEVHDAVVPDPQLPTPPRDEAGTGAGAGTSAEGAEPDPSAAAAPPPAWVDQVVMRSSAGVPYVCRLTKTASPISAPPLSGAAPTGTLGAPHGASRAGLAREAAEDGADPDPERERERESSRRQQQHESLVKLWKGVCVQTPPELITRAQYWNMYRVCLFDRVTQHHVDLLRAESTSAVVVELGSFVEGLLVQRYDGADGRSTTVVVECDPGMQPRQAPVLAQAVESALKVYRITLRAREACNSPHGVPGQALHRHPGAAMPAADAPALGGAAGAELHRRAAAAAAASASASASAPATTSAPGSGTYTPPKGLDVFSDVCVTRTFGYWTYEVCPQRSVRQFHGTPPRPGADNVLGRFDAEATRAAKARPLRALQIYSGGSECGKDKANLKQRSARVWFRCNPDAEMLTIESVDESQTCSYDVHLAAASLCSTPGFRPNDDTEPLAWKCGPAAEGSLGGAEPPAAASGGGAEVASG